MGEFDRSPTCNQVLSTYDISRVIKFTRLSPFLFFFSFACGESLGTRLATCSVTTVQHESLSMATKEDVLFWYSSVLWRWWFYRTILRLHYTFRSSVHNLQYLRSMWILTWLVVLIQILTWLAVKEIWLFRTACSCKASSLTHLFTSFFHILTSHLSW